MRSSYASKQLTHEIWPEFIAHFKSSTTKASYESDLDELMDYLKKDFLLINDRDMESYFTWMQHKIKEGRLNPSTLSKKCRELHSLAEYICENKDRYNITKNYKDVYADYLPYMTKQEKFASSVPVRHMDLLLRAAQKDTMAYCIIAMLYRAGMSSTEVCALRMDDFEIYEKWNVRVCKRKEGVVLHSGGFTKDSGCLSDR